MPVPPQREAWDHKERRRVLDRCFRFAPILPKRFGTCRGFGPKNGERKCRVATWRRVTVARQRARFRVL